MYKINRTIIVFILTCFINPDILFSNQIKNNDVEIIVLGHTYDLIDFGNIDEFIGHINSKKPDYVIILGDADLWYEKFYNKWKYDIQSEVYFVPGNHDLFRDRKVEYNRLIGYDQKVVVADKVNIVLFNSSKNIDQATEFLTKNLTGLPEKNTTILFTHHRIWDDNLISEFPYQHEKPFLFDDIYPSIKGKVDYIISGNSPRQYFGGTEFLGKYQKNPYIAYWCDLVYDIWCYSIGMGHSSVATYAIIRLNESGLMVEPISSVEFEKFNNKELISIDKIGRELPKKVRNLYLIIVELLTAQSLWLGILIGILSTCMFYYLKR